VTRLVYDCDVWLQPWLQSDPRRRERGAPLADISLLSAFQMEQIMSLRASSILLAATFSVFVMRADAAGPRLTLVYGNSELVNNSVHHEGGVVVSRNGRHVFATRAENYGLLEARRSRASGEAISHAGSAYGADWWPTGLVMSRDDKRLYVVGNWPDAILIGFIEPSGRGMRNARMLPRNVMPPPGVPPEDPCCLMKGIRQLRGIAISPDDRHLYATSIADNSLVILAPQFWKTSQLPNAAWDGTVRQIGLFQDDGVSGADTDAERIAPIPLDGATSVDGLKAPRGVVVSHDGRDVYVAGSGEDAIATFRRDQKTGRLQFVAAVKEPEASPGYGLGSPLHLLLSPDDRFLYVVCGRDSVVAFRRSAETGQLKWIQSLRNGRDGIDCLEYPRQAAINPKGDLLFVAASGRGTGNAALSTFMRDAKTGKLALSHVLSETDDPKYGLRGLASVCVSPDVRHVYTTSAEFSIGAYAVRRQ
jgi:DNA-binding beta-propeller fold protein YncE